MFEDMLSKPEQEKPVEQHIITVVEEQINERTTDEI